MLRGAIEAVALVALIAGALAIAPIERAGAQYPEPIGDVIIAVGDATAGPGEDVVVTATVLDENGAAVAGASCTFAIGGQPGTDASVQPGPFTTDAEGRVSTTLSTGSGEGEVVVEATCVQTDCPVDADGCDLSATATVSVGGQAAPPGSQAEPPASLPDTGGGPDGAGGASGWAFFALGAGAVLTAFAAKRLRRRPSR